MHNALVRDSLDLRDRSGSVDSLTQFVYNVNKIRIIFSICEIRNGNLLFIYLILTKVYPFIHHVTVCPRRKKYFHVSVTNSVFTQ